MSPSTPSDNNEPSLRATDAVRNSPTLPALGPGEVPVELKDLGDELRRRFSASAAADQDLCIDLDTNVSVLIRLRIKNNQLALSFHDRKQVEETADSSSKADVRFYFTTPALSLIHI